ncbi:hypothetical protein [Streptomyces canarius]|uniref:Uncharacterized protein n=1 Tax=Streptomyces canarius TaxID=285453 RepID=A0ABQ3CIH6_9ACTN|nr:hypothetical protein GCM10010345_19480 [Streptomyces canarius]
MLRQDQLFVAEDGTLWVRTEPAPDVADDDIRRHRALRREYDRPAGGGFLGLGGAPAAAREDGAVEGVWWAAGGPAVGVLGTLLVRSAAARRVPGRRGTSLVRSWLISEGIRGRHLWHPQMRACCSVLWRGPHPGPPSSATVRDRQECLASRSDRTDQPGSATPGTVPRSLLATAQHSPAPRRGPHLVRCAPASRPPPRSARASSRA